MRSWQTQVKCALATVLCVVTGAAVLLPSSAEAADTAAYIGFAAPLAQQEYTRYGVPASVAIAQSILESGWGGSGLTTEANNYFGIKCPASGSPANSGSPYVTGCVAKDSYEYPGPVLIRSYFRSYASAQNSFLDHGLLLSSRSWYAPAFAYTTDPDQFIREVAKGGYATDPGYADLVIRIMRQYNLYRFDPVRPTPIPSPSASPTAAATPSASATASPSTSPSVSATPTASTTPTLSVAPSLSGPAPSTPIAGPSAVASSAPPSLASPAPTTSVSPTVTVRPTVSSTPSQPSVTSPAAVPSTPTPGPTSARPATATPAASPTPAAPTTVLPTRSYGPVTSPAAPTSTAPTPATTPTRSASTAPSPTTARSTAVTPAQISLPEPTAPAALVASDRDRAGSVRLRSLISNSVEKPVAVTSGWVAWIY